MDVFVMEKWQIASAIATIVQGIVVIVSLIFIWRQIQLQTKQINLQTNLAKAANTQALVALASPMNIELVKDPQMAKFWVEGAEGFENYNDVDKYRYKSLLIWWLILHENVFYQKQNGLLDATIYLSWDYDLKHFVERQKLQLHWPRMKDYFQKDFSEHIGKLIQDINNKSSSQIPSRASHPHLEQEKSLKIIGK